MAYNTARMRAYYGAGDYSTGLALRQAYAGGAYYPAGGFLSSLGSIAKKAVGVVSKVAANPLVSTGLSLLPFGGVLGKGASIASSLLTKAKPVLSAVGKVAGTAAIGAGTAALVNKAMAGSPVTPAQAAGGRAALRSFGGGGSSGTARSKPRKKSRGKARRAPARRRSRSRPRGDLRDDRGRWVEGYVPMPYPHSGHYHGPKRGRRRGGGGKVSFTTKDGRRVSFTARGDA